MLILNGLKLVGALKLVLHQSFQLLVELRVSTNGFFFGILLVCARGLHTSSTFIQCFCKDVVFSNSLAVFQAFQGFSNTFLGDFIYIDVEWVSRLQVKWILW